MKRKPYGKELILDIHGVDPSQFGQDNLQKYFGSLHELMGVEVGGLMIRTVEEQLYLNIFTCKEFDAIDVELHAISFFSGRIVNATLIDRE